MRIFLQSLLIIVLGTAVIVVIAIFGTRRHEPFIEILDWIQLVIAVIVIVAVSVMIWRR